MKTHGICSTQSARKHRKQGHAVTRLLHGRYAWSSLTAANTSHYDKQIAESIAFAGMITREMTARHAPDLMGITVVTADGDCYTINVGDQFWPRRRNQHSKTFKVLGFTPVPEKGTHLVRYSTPQGDFDTATAHGFLAMVGKPVA